MENCPFRTNDKCVSTYRWDKECKKGTTPKDCPYSYIRKEKEDREEKKEKERRKKRKNGKKEK